MHEQLMLITAKMPMKTIEIDGLPYLERYFVGIDANGTQDWLHRFLRADSERHVHSHPWRADSTILCGWYVEQVRKGSGVEFEVKWFSGGVNVIVPDRMHRIIDVEPDTWTHMRVYPGREPFWHFIDDDGNKTQMQASEPDWWKKYGARV